MKKITRLHLPLPSKGMIDVVFAASATAVETVSKKRRENALHDLRQSGENVRAMIKDDLRRMGA